MVTLDDTRRYDERYYLDEKNPIYLERILDTQRIISQRRILEEFTYSNLLDEYNKFVKKASDLVHELSLKDTSLSNIISTGILLSLGYFSSGVIPSEYKSEPDILDCFLGLSVINANFCCRHASSFIDDIMKKLNIKSYKYFCFSPEQMDLNPFTNRLNHMANVIYYNNVPYVYDAYNGNELLYFVDEFRANEFDSDFFLHYKPYFEMMYDGTSLNEIKQKLKQYKDSVGKSITYQEFLEIKNETILQIKESYDLLRNFVSETEIDLKDLKEEIQKIKRK